MPPWLGAVWRFVRRVPAWITDSLDWLLRVIEALLALGLAGVAFYFGYRILSGHIYEWEWETLKKAAERWQVVFVLLIPLFYRTVRIFIEEVREFMGAKRERGGQPGQEGEEPPSGRKTGN